MAKTSIIPFEISTMLPKNFIDTLEGNLSSNVRLTYTLSFIEKSKATCDLSQLSTLIFLEAFCYMHAGKQSEAAKIFDTILLDQTVGKLSGAYKAICLEENFYKYDISGQILAKIEEIKTVLVTSHYDEVKKSDVTKLLEKLQEKATVGFKVDTARGQFDTLNTCKDLTDKLAEQVFSGDIDFKEFDCV